jgi:RNA polymerase sigma factor (sigma-70 family)
MRRCHASLLARFDEDEINAIAVSPDGRRLGVAVQVPHRLSLRQSSARPGNWAPGACPRSTIRVPCREIRAGYVNIGWVPDIERCQVTGREGGRGVDTEERFNALYRMHYRAVLSYACRRTDHDTARDVVAETFLIAWRRLESVPADSGQAEPWLYGVARLVLANAERSQRRLHRLAARAVHDIADEAMADPALVVSERHRVLQALHRMPEAEREALRLIGWEGLDLAGAALAMGCSRSAMAMRLHRARLRLESELGAIDTGSIDISDQRLRAPRQHVVQHESR